MAPKPVHGRDSLSVPSTVPLELSLIHQAHYLAQKTPFSLSLWWLDSPSSAAPAWPWTE